MDRAAAARIDDHPPADVPAELGAFLSVLEDAAWPSEEERAAALDGIRDEMALAETDPELAWSRAAALVDVAITPWAGERRVDAEAAEASLPYAAGALGTCEDGDGLELAAAAERAALVATSIAATRAGLAAERLRRFAREALVLAALLCSCGSRDLVGAARAAAASLSPDRLREGATALRRACWMVR